MNARDEWSDWASQWQGQPVVDVSRLQRRMHAKRRRMLAMVAFEAVVSIGALGQTIRLLTRPGLGPRWTLFGVGAMAVVVVAWGLAVWLRRGTWRAACERMSDLLRLDARRAQAGIRLAQAQLWGMGVLVAGSIALAWPVLQPTAWMHDPALRRVLTIQIGANAPVALASTWFSLWYIRRQRRRLARITPLLAADD